MMAKIPEMDPNFADWYAQVFMDEGTTRATRWKGVVDTAAAARYQSVEVLLRLAFASGAPGGTKNESLEECYRALLVTISGQGKPLDATTSQREIQVLAAAVLVRLFAWMPDAALGVTTTSFNRARQPDLPMDLVGLAHRALHDLSQGNHNRLEIKNLEVPAPKVEFEVSEEAIESFDQTTWKGELDRLHDANQVATRSIVENQNKIVKLLWRQIALGNEELQMLWWLIGEQSAVAGKSFGKVESSLRPLAFAKELGRMTTISPGPASVVAMLSRAGIADKGMTVQDAVNAADRQWAEEVTSSDRISPISTPLHFALEMRAEIGNDEAWQALWAARTGLAADASLPATRLAELFYREHLYLHVVA